MEFLRAKLEVPAYEWRRVLKVKRYYWILEEQYIVSSVHGVSFEKWSAKGPIRFEERHVPVEFFAVILIHGKWD